MKYEVINNFLVDTKNNNKVDLNKYTKEQGKNMEKNYNFKINLNGDFGDNDSIKIKMCFIYSSIILLKSKNHFYNELKNIYFDIQLLENNFELYQVQEDSVNMYFYHKINDYYKYLNKCCVKLLSDDDYEVLKKDFNEKLDLVFNKKKVS